MGTLKPLTMTDRYYPKRYVPDAGPLESTYNEMNLMISKPRSIYPPGYSGHEHGSRVKFGYSIPAPNPLPQEPVDPEDPLVDYRAGKAIGYRPLTNQPILLQKAPPKEAVQRDTRAIEAAILGTTVAPQAPLRTEDEFSASFVPRTSPYLASIGGNSGITVEKAQPYIPAVGGCGTGFNSQQSGALGGTGMPLMGTTSTKEAYPVPKVERRGLEMLHYTVNRHA